MFYFFGCTHTHIGATSEALARPLFATTIATRAHTDTTVVCERCVRARSPLTQQREFNGLGNLPGRREIYGSQICALIAIALGSTHPTSPHIYIRLTNVPGILGQALPLKHISILSRKMPFLNFLP